MSEIIRMGDPTSHGGKVIEGSMFDICHGKPIAFIGHKTYCPLCKGTFPIIEGAMTMTFYGNGVALAGMKTACGATLIPTQFNDIVTYGSGNNDEGRPKVPIQAPREGTALSVPQSDSGPTHDMHFRITDASGAVLAGCPYLIVTAGGERVEGRTDSEGMTSRIASSHAEPATLHVYEHDVVPINANWDR